jgi:hypothetical protein
MNEEQMSFELKFEDGSSKHFKDVRECIDFLGKYKGDTIQGKPKEDIIASLEYLASGKIKIGK